MATYSADVVLNLPKAWRGALIPACRLTTNDPMHKILTLLLIGLLLACIRSSANETAVSSPIAALPSMKTQAIGRYLVDLPEDWSLALGSDVDLTYGRDANWKNVNIKVAKAVASAPTALQAVAASRVSELQGKYHLKAPSYNLFVSKTDEGKDAVLIRSLSDPILLDAYLCEVFKDADVAVVDISGEAYHAETPEQMENRLLGVASRTRHFDIAKDSGRGAVLGPVLIDANQDGERFRLVFRSDKVTDAVLEIRLNSNPAESDGGLIKRWNERKGMGLSLGFRYDLLRQGKTTVGGMPAEEMLMTLPEHDKRMVSFVAETLSIPASIAKPVIRVDLEVGGQRPDGEYAEASLSNEEAIALWDAIVKSIRLRPGAAP